MIKTIAIAVAVGLLAMSPCVFAEDGNNVPDQIGDIFTGKGNTYLGGEINHIPLPFIPATLTAWADAKVSKVPEGEKREVKGGIIVAVDWRDIFGGPVVE